MSSNDEFEEIISNIGDDFKEAIANAEDEEGAEDFDTPLDVIAHYWKHFFTGQKFTKGILIVESELEGGEKGKSIHMSTSDGVTSWDVMGMLKYCQEHLFYVSGDDDDDEDDDE